MNAPISLESIDCGELSRTLDDAISDAAASLIRAVEASNRRGQATKGLKSVVTLTVTLKREEHGYSVKGVAKVSSPARPASVAMALDEPHPETGEITLAVPVGGGNPRQARLADDDGPIDAPRRRRGKTPEPEPEPEETERSLGAGDRKSRSAGAA